MQATLGIRSCIDTCFALAVLLAHGVCSFCNLPSYAEKGCRCSNVREKILLVAYSARNKKKQEVKKVSDQHLQNLV